MLGLRFFVCDRCETVHASPEESRSCTSCEGGSVREITGALQTDTYFWRAGGDDR
jgi:hypothetical protein